jgi:hypothetical protein
MGSQQFMDFLEETTEVKIAQNRNEHFKRVGNVFYYSYTYSEHIYANIYSLEQEGMCIPMTWFLPCGWQKDSIYNTIRKMCENMADHSEKHSTYPIILVEYGDMMRLITSYDDINYYLDALFMSELVWAMENRTSTIIVVHEFRKEITHACAAFRAHSAVVASRGVHNVLCAGFGLPKPNISPYAMFISEFEKRAKESKVFVIDVPMTPVRQNSVAKPALNVDWKQVDPNYVGLCASDPDFNIVNSPDPYSTNFFRELAYIHSLGQKDHVFVILDPWFTHTKVRGVNTDSSGINHKYNIFVQNFNLLLENLHPKKIVVTSENRGKDFEETDIIISLALKYVEFKRCNITCTQGSAPLVRVFRQKKSDEQHSTNTKFLIRNLDFWDAINE